MIMPHVVPLSSFRRRRADYEDIDGVTRARRCYDYRLILALVLLCFGLVVTFISLAPLSIHSSLIDADVRWRTPAYKNGSLELEYLGERFMSVPHISQADIGQAYGEAVGQIAAEKLLEGGLKNRTEERHNCRCICNDSSTGGPRPAGNWTENCIALMIGCQHKVSEECGGDEDTVDDDRLNSRSTVRAYQYLTYNVNDDLNDMFAEARIVDRMTQIIARRFHLNRKQAGSGLPESRVGWRNCSSRGEDWPWTPRTTTTTRRGNCSGQYRSFDGRCNNLKHWKWGAAGATYRRRLPADYGDGISSPRRSSDGGELPSARAVSSQIHLAQKASEDLDHTILMTFWGQFITHDISSVASPTDNPPCNCQPPARNVSSCYPIDVSDDPFLTPMNVTCLPFIRSQAAAHPDCILGPREHVNLISSYLDGSVIYGSKFEETIELRSLKNGQLKTSTFHGESLLPVNTSGASSFCTQASKNKLCFFAGDSRCNENLMLTSLHTIFMREHNRISVELQKLNPEWTDDDERLFQEARRIVVAELQHITYSEYLQKLLGLDAIEARDDLRLETGSDVYYDGYSEDVDPTITNEFATAVFRFGHSMVRGVAKLLNSSHDEDFVQLHKGLYTPWRFQENNDTLTSLLYGGSRQNPFFVSPHYSTELGNRLFQGEGDRHGLDLAAITVQRGRDHGIPSYNAFRQQLCGQSSLTSPQDLERLFGKVLAQKFLHLYKKIDDIDLCSGGLAEPHVPRGMLGPTFACVVADQFSRLRRGDRFWYENGPGAHATHPFTPRQLAEIRKTTLARIICDNVPAISKLQPDAFSSISPSNEPVSCAQSNKIPRLNIVHWLQNHEDHFESND